MNHDMYQQFSVRRAGQQSRHPVPTAVNSSSSARDILHPVPWHRTVRAPAPCEAGYFNPQSSYQSMDFTGGRSTGAVNLNGQHIDSRYTNDCPGNVNGSTQHGMLAAVAAGQQHVVGSEVPAASQLYQLAVMRNMHQVFSNYGLGVPSGMPSSSMYLDGYLPTNGVGGIEFNLSTGNGMNASYNRPTAVSNDSGVNTGMRNQTFGNQPSGDSISSQLPMFNQAGGGMIPYGMDFNTGIQTHVSGVQPLCGSISSQLPMFSQAGGGMMPYKMDFNTGIQTHVSGVQPLCGSISSQLPMFSQAGGGMMPYRMDFNTGTQTHVSGVQPSFGSISNQLPMFSQAGGGMIPYGMDFNTGIQTHVSGVQPSCGSISSQLPIFSQAGGGMIPYRMDFNTGIQTHVSGVQPSFGSISNQLPMFSQAGGGMIPYGMDFNTGIQTHVSGVQPSCSSISSQLPMFSQAGGGMIPYGMDFNTGTQTHVSGVQPSCGSISTQLSMFSRAGWTGGVMVNNHQSRSGHEGLSAPYELLTSGISQTCLSGPGPVLSAPRFPALEPNRQYPHISHELQRSSHQMLNNPSVTTATIAGGGKNVSETRIFEPRQMVVELIAPDPACIPQSAIHYAHTPVLDTQGSMKIDNVHQMASSDSGSRLTREGSQMSLPDNAPTRSAEQKKRSRKRRRSSSIDSVECDVELLNDAGLLESRKDTSLTRQMRYELRNRNKAATKALTSEEPDIERPISETENADDSDQDPTWQEELDGNDNEKSVVEKSATVEFDSIASGNIDVHVKSTSLLQQKVTQYEDVSSTGDQPPLLMECYDDSDDVTTIERPLREKEQASQQKNIPPAEKTRIANGPETATSSTLKKINSLPGPCASDDVLMVKVAKSFNFLSSMHSISKKVQSEARTQNNQPTGNNQPTMTRAQSIPSTMKSSRILKAMLINSNKLPSKPGTRNNQLTLNNATRASQPILKSANPGAVSETAVILSNSRKVPNNFMLSKAILKKNANAATADFHLELVISRLTENSQLERLLAWQPSMGICSTERRCSVAVQNDSNKSSYPMCFQCAFCPLVGNSTRKIANHIAHTHREIDFALNRKTLNPEEHLLYLYCRHCNYVSYDEVMMLLHFYAFHSVSLAVNCDSLFHPNPMTAEKSRLTPANKADMFPFFCCTECKYMSLNRSHATDHVACEHASQFTNCFVSLVMVSKDNEPADKSTYSERAYSSRYASSRKQLYVCVRCNFFSFLAFCALSHNLLVHRTTCMAFVCDIANQSCEKRFCLIGDAKRHMQLVHGSGITGCFQMKMSVTLLNLIDNTAAVECFFQPGQIAPEENLPGPVSAKPIDSSNKAIEIGDDSDEDVIFVDKEFNEIVTRTSSLDRFTSSQAGSMTVDSHEPGTSGVTAIEECSNNVGVQNMFAMSSVACRVSGSLQEQSATSIALLSGLPPVLTVIALPNQNNPVVSHPITRSSLSVANDSTSHITSQQNSNTTSKNIVIDLCADNSESSPSESCSVLSNPNSNVISELTFSGILSQPNQKILSKDIVIDLCANNSVSSPSESCSVLSNPNSNVVSVLTLSVVASQNNHRESGNTLSKDVGVRCAESGVFVHNPHSSVTSESTSPLPTFVGFEGEPNHAERVSVPSLVSGDVTVTSSVDQVCQDCIWAEVDPSDTGKNYPSTSISDSVTGDTNTRPSDATTVPQDCDRVNDSFSSHPDNMNANSNVSSTPEQSNSETGVEEAVNTSLTSRCKRLASYRFNQTGKTNCVNDLSSDKNVVDRNSLFTVEELSQLNDLP